MRKSVIKIVLFSTLLCIAAIQLFPYTIEVCHTTHTHHDADGNTEDSEGNDITPDHPDYDHTEDHEHCSSYTLPNSVSPGEIQSALDELEDGSEADISVTEVEGSSSILGVNAMAIDNTFEDAESLIAEVEQEIEQLCGASSEQESLGNPADVGDPVRIPSGEFVTTAVDISYPYVNSAVKIGRKFQSGTAGAHSLGAGWSFTCDTRIVHGVKPRAEEEVIFISEKLGEVTMIYEESLALYNASMDKIEAVLDRVGEIKSDIDNTIAELQQALVDSPGKFHSKINSHLQSAIDKRDSVLLPFLNRAEAAKEELLATWPKIESMREQKEELEENLIQAQRELEMALANEARNRYVWNESDPAHEKYTGNTGFTLIDEDGLPHLYTIDAPPAYESDEVYEDGSVNYFPEGAAATPVLPNDDGLYIFPDGSYRVTKKDRSEYYYCYWGRLQKVRDRNGNELSFLYSDGELTEIRDDFGRSMLLERSGGLVRRITGPNGARIDYGYDGSRRLRSVTDAEGATVTYTYDGALLTSIGKPDGSSRRYQYALFDGQPRVVKTVDEEGNIEQYQYDLEENAGTYTNPSDVTEKHYYNDRNLETRVEYADGSSVDMEYDGQNNLVRRTDELGYTTCFAYDERRNLIERTDPAGNREQWSYNDFNRLTSHTDRLGRRTEYTYDAAGNLLSVEYPDGTQERFRYNGHGQPVESVDQMGNSTAYGYDGNGYLSMVTAADGGEWRYEYDEVGNLIQSTGPLGGVTCYEYNLDNALVRLTDAAGHSETYEYDERKDLRAVVDKRGGRTEYEYDGRHLLTKVINPLGETVEYSYRGDGKLVLKNIDDMNHTRYEYDQRGNLVAVTQQESESPTCYSYDAAGRWVSVVDPNGAITDYGYDYDGRLIWEKDALGNTHFLEYDAEGNLVEAVDRLGRKTEYSYDELDRLIELRDPLGSRVKYTYDAAGNLIGRTDRRGSEFAYCYDELGQLDETVDPAGASEHFAYDRHGRMVRRTDRRGNIRRYEYDAVGNLLRAVDPLEEVRQYSWDPAGNLIARTDERGNTIFYKYDAAGRMTAEEDAYGNRTLYRYDARGQLIERSDALGNTTCYEYNGLGRLIRQTDSLGASKVYSYDPAGNLIEAVDEESRRRLFTYDPLGRLASETDGAGNSTFYQYDAKGNLTGETDPNGNLYRREYDGLDRLVKEINRLGSIQTYTYDPEGNLTGKTDFNGNDTEYSYCPLGRLVTVKYADGREKSFAYDAVGNMTEAAGEETSLRYSYDPSGRLLTAEEERSGQGLAYSYDETGNRLSIKWIETGRETTYTYGKMNEVLSVTDADGRTTDFSYDSLLRETERKFPNGITTNKSYDAAGRLTSIQNSGSGRWGQEWQLSSEAYLYNRAGERTFTVDESGKITAYSYDDAGRLAKALYPFCSGKPAVDFRERLELGLLPSREDVKENQPAVNTKHRTTHSGQTEESIDSAPFFFTLPSIADRQFNRRQFEDAMEQIFEENRMLHYSVQDRRDSGKAPIQPNRPNSAVRWHVKPGAGATAFATPLKLSTEEEQALREAYEMISSADTHGWSGRLNTDQWMWSEHYSYDSRGNRSKKANGWGCIEYTYNDANQIEAAGNCEYLHDGNGNLVEETLGRLTVAYLYSPENRIEEVRHEFSSFDRPSQSSRGRSSQSRVIAYSYDPLGRRISRESWREYGQHERGYRDPETSHAYLYDGLSFTVLAEIKEAVNNPFKGKTFYPDSPHYKPITEYITAGGSIVSRAELKRPWTYIGNHALNGKLVNYYHQDMLGSTMMLTNKSSREQQSFSYDAFGSLYGDRPHPGASSWISIPREWNLEKVRTESSYTLHLYTGKLYDSEAGLYNYGYRDYDPQLGRFTSVDPIKYKKNWYAYCGNNPVNFVDPLGLAEIVGTYGSEIVTEHTYVGTQYFNQESWSDDLSEDFALNSCAATSLLNELSEEFTSLKNERLTEDQAVKMLYSAIESNSISESDAYVNNWSSAAQSMWGALREDLGSSYAGTWNYDENGSSHIIYAEDPNQDEIADHFVNSSGNGSAYDVWSGETLNIDELLLQPNRPHRNLQFDYSANANQFKENN